LRFINGTELHKRIIPLHVNTNELSKGFKKHLEIFTLGGFLVEVDDKQGLAGGNLLAAFVFFTLDASISACKLSTKCPGNPLDVHSIDFGHITLDTIFVG